MAHRLAGPGPPSASVCGSCAGATRASRIDGARAAAAASQRVWWCPPFGSLRGRQTLGGAGRRRSGRRGADAPATTTTTVVCAAAEGEGFFESNIVQNEMDRLQDDYQNLLKLGRRYGQFDRQGKKLYIQEMKDVIERWQIFYKRMELSDDFTAKICAKQLRARGGPLGLSNLDLVQSLYLSLDEMSSDVDNGQ